MYLCLSSLTNIVFQINSYCSFLAVLALVLLLCIIIYVSILC